MKGTEALQFRIVAAAGALIGIGPALVEHIFARANGSSGSRACSSDAASAVVEQEMARPPAGLRRRGAALLQRGKNACVMNGLAGRLGPVREAPCAQASQSDAGTSAMLFERS